jgi:hypothetical protein
VYYIIARMRIRAVVAAAALVLAAATFAACSAGRGSAFRLYEYEEEIYLSLDGSAVVYVNASLPALDALRGAGFDSAPNAPIDRDAARRFFSTPVARLRSVSFSRRSDRRFVHVRLDVDDVRRLSEAAPFSWSTYAFARGDDGYVYRQTVGAAAGKHVGQVGWTGRELVAFRLHLPSTITFQNAGAGAVERGNVVTWEQSLGERLRGAPLTIEARMEPRSILYDTLRLFGLTFAAVAACFVVVIWWMFRRGSRPAEV